MASPLAEIKAAMPAARPWPTESRIINHKVACEVKIHLDSLGILRFVS